MEGKININHNAKCCADGETDEDRKAGVGLDSCRGNYSAWLVCQQVRASECQHDSRCRAMGFQLHVSQAVTEGSRGI